MPKAFELYQLVARSIHHATWNIPRIRDGDRWRDIDNAYLVANPNHINGHDRFEGAIFRARQIMDKLGWATELSDDQVRCHEHLVYQHYRLRCQKS